MALQYANLALRFLLELCVLAALGVWGFRFEGGLFVKWLLGLGAPLLAAVVWGTFASPKASIPLHGVLHGLVELVVFGSGVVALYAAGYPTLAFVFGIVIVVNRVLMIVWGQ
jgi:hypothetical protein